MTLEQKDLVIPLKFLNCLKRFHSASNPNFNRQSGLRHLEAAIENRYIYNFSNSFLSTFTVLEIRTVYFFLGGRLAGN
eukprot:jgi/Orpsp1_1/1187938/evm.model.d7180000061302.1